MCSMQMIAGLDCANFGSKDVKPSAEQLTNKMGASQSKRIKLCLKTLDINRLLLGWLHRQKFELTKLATDGIDR